MVFDLWELCVCKWKDLLNPAGASVKLNSLMMTTSRLRIPLCTEKKKLFYIWIHKQNSKLLLSFFWTVRQLLNYFHGALFKCRGNNVNKEIEIKESGGTCGKNKKYLQLSSVFNTSHYSDCDPLICFIPFVFLSVVNALFTHDCPNNIAQGCFM